MRIASTGAAPSVISRAVAKGKAALLTSCSDHALQHLARPRPAEIDHRPARGDVGEPRRSIGGQMLADPMGIMHGEAAAGDDVEAVGCQPRDGEIAFDPAALVAELGIDDAADRLVHAGGGEPVDGGERAGAAELEFAEGALVDEGDPLAHRPMLGRHRLEPVGPAEGGAVLRAPCRRARTSSAAPSPPWSHRPRPSPSADDRAGCA